MYVHSRSKSRERQVSMRLEIQGGKDFKSAQSASPTSGVSLEEGKERYCARRRRTDNRKAEGSAT